jgi:hypothetical protein
MLASYIVFEIIMLKKWTSFCSTMLSMGIIQLFYSEEDLFYIFGARKTKYEDFVR